MNIQIDAQEIRNRSTEHSFKRGKKYFDDGAVTDMVRRGNRLEALCKGSRTTPYRVGITLDEYGIRSAACNCEYENGGDCKHIVAVLLAYTDNADAFILRPRPDEILNHRSKDELVALILEMIHRDPELEILLDRPLPGHPLVGPINTESYRRELRRALSHYQGWGDDSAERMVYSVTEAANDFLKAGDATSAAAIYMAILDEVMELEYYPFDDDGDFIVAVDGVVQQLIGCLAQAAVGDNETLRAAVLGKLVEAYLNDLLDTGDFAADVPDAVLKYAHREDRARIRAKIVEAREAKLKQFYDKYTSESYNDFLQQLENKDRDEKVQQEKAAVR